MAGSFLFEHWRERLHACADFSSEKKCDEFLSLLTDAERHLTDAVVMELIRTFSDADDFGIQERTRNLVAAADRSIYYPALVYELSGLITRSPEKQWAVTLLGMEAEYGDFGMLVNYAEKSPENERSTFLAFARSDEFLSEYPAVSRYLNGC